ncbi:MAG: type II toxin-antitoxin system RelE/ParE family toxin [Acidobacteria bacterium]|nr:type II toxin-antitoxin system RelE/ParE family toxin [Acidobacteriota bacterium]
MARYRLVIKESAAKEIESVGQKRDRQRIVERIRSLSENPRPFGCEKLSGHQDRYRVRAGRYRIVYAIRDEELVVYVVKVGHRKDVYRRES